MAVTNYNKYKNLKPSSYNDSGANIVKAQPIGVVGNNYTGFDGFESGSSQLGFENQSNNIFLNTSSDVYGENNLGLIGDESDADVNVQRSLVESISTDNKILTASIKTPYTSLYSNTPGETILKFESGSTVAVELEFRHDGNIYHNNTQVSTFTEQTVLDIEIEVDFTNNQSTLRIDGEVIDSNRAFVNNVSVIDALRLQFAAGDTGGATNGAYLDRLTYTSNAEDTINASGIIGIDDTNVAGPSDLAVYDGNDNLIPFEFENPEVITSSGLSDVLWIWTFPSVVGNWTRDGTVQAQLVYGNGPASSEENVTGTWNNTGQNIWSTHHFEEEPDTDNQTNEILDSSSNDRDMDTYGTTSTTSSLNGALSFDGVDDVADTGEISSLSGARTVISHTTPAVDGLNQNDFCNVFSLPAADNVNRNVGFWIQIDDNGVFDFGTRDSGGLSEVASNTELNAGETYVLGHRIDSNNNFQGFIDGSQVVSGSNSGQVDTDGLIVGAGGDGSVGNYKQFYEGSNTETRVYTDYKSDAWMQAEFDASPKGGQTFFVQEAAQTTVTTTEETFTQDTAIENRDVTKQLSTDLILENPNIPEQFNQDVALAEVDVTEQFNNDVTLQDRDVTESFTQDVTLFARDVEKPFNQDVAVENQGQEQAFSQDVFLSENNQESFSQDVAVKELDRTKQLSTDLILENPNIPEQFNQDVAVKDRDTELTFSQTTVVSEKDTEKTFTQDTAVSDRMERSFSQDLVIARQPAPDTKNPLSVKVLNPTETFTKVLNPTETYVDVKEHYEK